MPATTPSAALVPAVPASTNTGRLALAGFLAGYRARNRLGRAVFPELPAAALCATSPFRAGTGTGPVGRPRIPSARWLRTFGSFRVGRAVPTMMA